ncbi:MAG TPA: hypothetical protein VGQ00_01915 [Candidatus Norongarragalinales archaeon]|nr:hypothetical protein [Candidatus Norongarragalinales archaeon]
MSKLERFLREGHQKTVIEHLEKLKNPDIIAKALFHRNEQVQFAAVKRLREFGPAAVHHARTIIEQVWLEDWEFNLNEGSGNSKLTEACEETLGKMGPKVLDEIRKLSETKLGDEEYQKFLLEDMRERLIRKSLSKKY